MAEEGASGNGGIQRNNVNSVGSKDPAGTSGGRESSMRMHVQPRPDIDTRAIIVKRWAVIIGIRRRIVITWIRIVWRSGRRRLVHVEMNLPRNVILRGEHFART